ncbi:MAG: translocation/assembly module TamB domain-containing protein, partial [Saprospiraceae bacterium]
LSGRMDIVGRGKDLSTMQGTIQAADLKMIHDNSDQYLLDSIFIYSNLTLNNTRTLKIDTDILTADLKGQFDIQEVPEAVAQFLESNFPEISDRVGLKSKGKNIKPTDFTYNITITDSQNFTNLLTTGIDTIRNATATGFIDTDRDILELNANVPFLQYKNLTFEELYADISSDKSYAEIEAGVYRTIFKDQNFEPVSFEGVIHKDTMDFSLNSTNFNSLLDDLNLNGEFFFTDEYFQVRFLPSDLAILTNKWTIEKDNYIRFGEGFVETKNFDLNSFEKRIRLQSIGNRGLNIGLENIRLNLIDEFWNFPKMNFDGQLNVNASIMDIFKLEDIRATAIADTLEINGDDWGLLRLDLEMKNKDAPIDAFMTITKGQEQMTAEGYVGPFTNQPRKNLNRKDYNFDLAISSYSLSIAEYFIENGLSNTIGTFDANVNLNGDFKGRPNIGGTLEAFDLALTIDYLNTRYSMPNGIARINNLIFDVSDNYLIDKNGNRALIQGGIVHDHLSNFALDATISSDEFLFLDTDIEDNSLYYGTAYGSGFVKFTGTFKQTDIFIDATTRRNSVLSIPVSYDQNASEVTFIKYVDRDEEIESEEDRRAKELRGVNVHLFLDVTSDAEVYIIFDERAGDKIRGRGTGNINLEVDRDGTIEMFGDYNIAEGEYLFTLLNLVNKPFTVKQGGTIKWTGDPFNAEIDLEATYYTRTALSTLLLEYFDGTSNVDLENLARTSTRVDLVMYLTGKLLSPEINFNINFPNVDNELRNLVESKLSTMRANQNELNRQVFGLMVVGSFLPGGQDALNGIGGDIGFNTVTEMLSSQLSIYLTGLLSEVFTDIGFISGLDFDINYSRYTAETTSVNGPEFQTGSELEVRLSNTLFNDRLSVNVGGNIDWGNTTLVGPSEGAFLAGDVVLEYILTRDKRFKVRFYQRTDQTFEGRRNKTGLGFSYRREFDSFGEFIKGMKRTVRGK